MASETTSGSSSPIDRRHLTLALVVLVATVLVPFSYVAWSLAFTELPGANTTVVLALTVLVPATLAFGTTRYLGYEAASKAVFVVVVVIGLAVGQVTIRAFGVG